MRRSERLWRAAELDDVRGWLVRGFLCTESAGSALEDVRLEGTEGAGVDDVGAEGLKERSRGLGERGSGDG